MKGVEECQGLAILFCSNVGGAVAKNREIGSVLIISILGWNDENKEKR